MILEGQLHYINPIHAPAPAIGPNAQLGLVIGPAPIVRELADKVEVNV